jgi:transcriptional regulator GlxA family with amidase domain
MIENNSSNNPKNMPDLYVQKAIEYLNTHYSINISIEHVAYTLGIDRRYLCRIFKKKKGETPQSYLINLRLERAALLLTQYNFSVEDVTRSTGYNDICNFSKMFKKKYGLSPKTYSKVHKQINISL